MLAGQLLAATIGYGTKANIMTPISMDLNGNAITVSNDARIQMKKMSLLIAQVKLFTPLMQVA